METEDQKIGQKAPIKRKYILISLSSITFFLFIGTIFWQRKLLLGAILFALLFIQLIFLSIDLRRTQWRKLLSILGGFGLLIWFFMPNPVWQLVSSMWLILGTIGFLILHLRGYFEVTRKLNRLNYFTRGGYIFALMMSIIFGLLIMGMNSKFPLKCSDIENLNNHLIHAGTQGIKKTEILQQSETSTTSTLGSTLNTFKNNLFDGFLNTQKSINSKICETIVDQLESIYEKPLFQIGVVFTMYLLFYGLIRILVWIITFVGYIIFHIIMLFGGYKVEKKLEEVETVL